jgi:Asp-tRNA(Asn)/Glu-tRNA(Gln) amidotransferase A subunit family amidase
LSGPGAFGRDAADTRLLLEALLDRELPTGDGSSLRVAVIRDPFWTDLDPEVATTCESALAATGWQVSSVGLPYAELAAPAGGVRAASELGSMVPSRLLPDVDPITRGMLQYSALMPARRLIRADRVRAKLRRGLADLFASYDAIAWPTNPAPAPAIANPVVNLPSGPSLADTPNLRQAVIANLAGVPGVSVPVGLHSSGLPIGLQLLATWGGEATLLGAASRIEQTIDRAGFDAGPPQFI